MLLIKESLIKWDVCVVKSSPETFEFDSACHWMLEGTFELISISNLLLLQINVSLKLFILGVGLTITFATKVLVLSQPFPSKDIIA